MWGGANLVRACGLLLICVVSTGCTAADDNPMPELTITEVLERHSSEIMAIPGVVGIGEGECDGSDCIRVYVVEQTPELLDRIPSSVEGFPVVVTETGEIRPLQ